MLSNISMNMVTSTPSYRSLTRTDFQNQFEQFMKDDTFIKGLMQQIKIGPINLFERMQKIHGFRNKRKNNIKKKIKYELKGKIAKARLR
jgi:hypothetical protein